MDFFFVDKTPSKKMKLNSSSSSDGMVQSELKLLAVRLVEAGPDLIPDISGWFYNDLTPSLSRTRIYSKYIGLELLLSTTVL